MDQYAVFGNPIAHSKSPWLHSNFAKQCQQQLHYQAILAPFGEFSSSVKSFIAQGGKGANVTVPFKLDAFQICDHLSARAQAAGAVNTLVFSNGEIIGDNTDGCGLVTDITLNASFQIANQKILLLGAGGAAQGAILPLLELGPELLMIANRTPEKAAQLAARFKPHGNVTHCQFEDISQSFDLIINATSASLGNECPPIADLAFHGQTLAYDMMYGATLTPFLIRAQKSGAMVRDGWGMLVEQAAEAFYLWRAVRPKTAEIVAARFPS